MNRALSIAALAVATALLYLLLWPVPIDPVAWQAPRDRGLADPYLPNRLLQAARAIDLGNHEGPEDATLGHGKAVYATTRSGNILRVRDTRVDVFADVGGRPLGIEIAADGSLVVANALIGLQRVTMDGTVSTLYGGADAPVFANNLAVAPDGLIYFTEASRKFSAMSFGDTM